MARATNAESSTSSYAVARKPTLRHRLVSAITRRYPFISGCSNLANSRLLERIAGSADDVVWSRLDCGLRMLVPLDDFVGRSVYFIGDLDRKLTRVIKRIVRPGDRVMDIGANIGVVTLPLAKFVGGGGVVYAFEPNPLLLDLLGRTLECNDLKNVQLHRCALGDEEGEGVLSYHRVNLGMGTLAPPQYDLGWTGVRVPIRTIDTIAKEVDLTGIRLVKLDAEEYEEHVLRGARGWLASSPPDVFLIESNDDGEQGKRTALSLLVESGYALYTIPRALFSVRLIPYHSEGYAENRSHDMVAIRRDCEREIVALFRS